MRGSRAAAPKGTKSCRTQGDFRSSCLKKWIRCYRGLTEGLQGPKLRSKTADVRPQNANWKLERADFRSERADFRPERAWRGGRTDGRMDGRMNERKSPVFYRTSSPSGPLPKKRKKDIIKKKEKKEDVQQN